MSDTQKIDEIFSKYQSSADSTTIAPHSAIIFSLNWDDQEITDNAGFIYETNSLSESSRINLIKSEQKRASREKKWMRMLRNIENTSRRNAWNPPKLSSRVYKGVPHAIRALIWPHLLRTTPHQHTFHMDTLGGPQKLEQLLHTARTNPSFATRKAVQQIDMDIPRCLTKNRHFADATSHLASPTPTHSDGVHPDKANNPVNPVNTLKCDLFHALVAYAQADPEFGYTQGCSFIAAVLCLSVCGGAQAVFSALTSIMTGERRLHRYYGLDEFPRALQVTQSAMEALRRFEARLYTHLFDRLLFTRNFIAVRWTFTLFIGQIPSHLAMRVIDIYMLEGESTLISMIFNIFKLHKGHLLQQNDLSSVYEWVENLKQDFGVEDDQAIKSLKQCKKKLERAKFLELDPPGTLREDLKNIDLELPEIAQKTLSNNKQRNTLTPQREQHQLESGKKWFTLQPQRSKLSLNRKTADVMREVNHLEGKTSSSPASTPEKSTNDKCEQLRLTLSNQTTENRVQINSIVNDNNQNSLDEDLANEKNTESSDVQMLTVNVLPPVEEVSINEFVEAAQSSEAGESSAELILVKRVKTVINKDQ